ncbi:MAG: hypothetical protein JSW28_08605 [Thermoplasmata archaeon]|nr:MAG: hypothetical protein JSW28_08605 [Thermoplasmata archaeon]
MDVRKDEGNMGELLKKGLDLGVYMYVNDGKVISNHLDFHTLRIIHEDLSLKRKREGNEYFRRYMIFCNPLLKKACRGRRGTAPI